MTILGRRADGALLVSLVAGMGIIMRGTFASKPFDLSVVERMGPWHPTDNSLQARRAAQQQLDRCRVLTLSNFDCGR